MKPAKFSSTVDNSSRNLINIVEELRKKSTEQIRFLPLESQINISPRLI